MFSLLCLAVVYAKWDHMFSFSCDNQMTFFGDNPKLKFVGEAPSHFGDVMPFIQDAVIKSIQKVCPAATTDLLQRILLGPDIGGSVLRVIDKDVTDIYDRYLSSVCPAGTVDVDGFIADTLRGFVIALPTTCNYNRWTTEKKCDMEITLTDTVAFQISMRACANSVLPQVHIKCSGTGCADFLKPCVSDDNCETKCSEHLINVEDNENNGLQGMLTDLLLFPSATKADGQALVNTLMRRVASLANFDVSQDFFAEGRLRVGFCGLPESNEDFDGCKLVSETSPLIIRGSVCGRVCTLPNDEYIYNSGYYQEHQFNSDGTIDSSSGDPECKETFPSQCKTNDLARLKSKPEYQCGFIKASPISVQGVAAHPFNDFDGSHMASGCDGSFAFGLTSEFKFKGKTPFDAIGKEIVAEVAAVLKKRDPTITPAQMWTHFFPHSLQFISKILDSSETRPNEEFDGKTPLASIYTQMVTSLNNEKELPEISGMPASCDIASMKNNKCKLQVDTEKMTSKQGLIRVDMETCQENALGRFYLDMTGELAQAIYKPLGTSCTKSEGCATGQMCLKFPDYGINDMSLANPYFLKCTDSSTCDGNDNFQCVDGLCRKNYDRYRLQMVTKLHDQSPDTFTFYRDLVFKVLGETPPSDTQPGICVPKFDTAAQSDYYQVDEDTNRFTMSRMNAWTTATPSGGGGGGANNNNNGGTGTTGSPSAEISGADKTGASSLVAVLIASLLVGHF